MKKALLEEVFEDIKYRLVSDNLRNVADSLKSKTRNTRDFIEVRTLIKVFENMAKDRVD